MKPVFRLLSVGLLLTGCSTTHIAPVVDLTSTNSATGIYPVLPATPGAQAVHPAIHVVQKGETLYSIALEYGLDYRQLAAWNHLDNINHIQIGMPLQLSAANPASNDTINGNPDAGAGVQVTAIKPESVTTQANGQTYLITQPQAIKLPYSQAALTQLTRSDGGANSAGSTANVLATAAKPVLSANNVVATSQMTAQPASEVGLNWTWPANGRVIAGFGDAATGKGIDISGTRGQPIFAAAAGKVVYSGIGLHGYGKLVIIKHDAIYLTAYAHNQAILVKEGQTVSRGQQIAEMGDSDADQVELHFEVRQMGKPVDPLKYLPQASK